MVLTKEKLLLLCSSKKTQRKRRASFKPSPPSKNKLTNTLVC